MQFGSSGGSEGVISAGSGQSTVNSAINLQNTLTTVGSQQINFNGPITLTGPQSINVNGATAEFASGNTLSGGNLTKIGPGVLELAGNYSTYTGNMTVNTGTLQLGDGGSDGTLSGTTALTTNANLVFNQSGTATVPNAISGTGNVAQGGSGTLLLSGALNYSGNTIINSGTFQLNSANELTISPLVMNGGNFNLNGLTETIAGLNGTGNINNAAAGAATLNVAGGGSFGGVITNGGGSVTLVKSGGGSLTLAANVNNPHRPNDQSPVATLALKVPPPPSRSSIGTQRRLRSRLNLGTLGIGVAGNRSPMSSTHSTTAPGSMRRQ